ncbi:N-lysine methyltransferase SETD8 [Microtus ochrogaster]|uniref:N-lysine methyltransferase SETD8 n=1 Tax=Microtus ochrogaster TaxID=79684 RepID=A0A8J6FYZ3_MICOH|nr:N-lysine methyltransferase SETD8 [Microtus ochrogaster]
MEAGVPENVFVGQSKIYAYMSPNKCSGMCSPLQEENSVAHHEVKCQGKPLAGIYRKREEKRNAGNPIRSSVKSDEQRRSKRSGEVPWHRYQTKNLKQQSLQKLHLHHVSLPILRLSSRP